MRSLRRANDNRIGRVWPAFLALLLFTVLSASARACEEDSTVVRYLGAIQAMDWHTMAGLLADRAHYTDPTMTHYDRPPIDLTGRDAVVDFWRASSEASGTGNINYTITRCFETAGYHVVSLDIAIEVAGAFWNINSDEVVIPGQVVSVIREENGVVTEHHDYVDYAGVDPVIDSLRQQYGTVE